ncbi:MAG TPA: redoxin domain-containing protein [Polyangiaceae bacterium]|nr:redoxin domain-containing protein [Polyangiaceae bacterium]
MARASLLRVMAPNVCLVAVAALALAACSSSEKQVPFDDGQGQVAAPELGAPREVYPAAPYGSRAGAIIENFDFLGWKAPTNVAFDTTKLEQVSLGQFYDPDGAKGVKLLVMTSTAVWCSACKQEYKDMTGNITTYEGKGVRFLGALFEDDASQPAQPSDLVLWAKAFNVAFPFALDPDLKLGKFFDVEATPMEMIVDAKTMKIVKISEGWVTQGDGSLWSDLDTLLASR